MLASRSMRAAAQQWSPLVAALVLTAAALFFGGGSGDGSLPWLGGAAIVLALVFAATRPLPGGLLPFAPLAALAVWSALSVAWSIEPDRSWAYANRGLVYLAFALVGAFAADRIRELMLGLAAILGAVCVWSLAGKALPWLYDDYERVARLRAPIGYWNALALLGAIALPIGLCLATRRRVPGDAARLRLGRRDRADLLARRGDRRRARRRGLDGALPRLGRGARDARRGRRARRGRDRRRLLARGRHERRAVALDACDATASCSASRSSPARALAALLARVPPPEPVAAVRRAALALLAVMAAAAIVVGATQARSWWDSFTSPTVTRAPEHRRPLPRGGLELPLALVEAGVARLGGAPGRRNRRGLVRLHEPPLPHVEPRPRTTEPHSLPVQFLTETGVVGLLLFVLAGAGLVGAARRRAGPQLALALALPAYLAHGLIDIDWDFAAVTAPVFLIAGAVAARPAEARRLSAPAVLACGGVAFAVVCSLFAVWLGDRWTGQASEALDRPAHAVALAKRARSVNPLAVEPLFVQALAEQLRGNLGRGARPPPGGDAAPAREQGDVVRARRVRPRRPQLPEDGPASSSTGSRNSTRRTRATRSTTGR